jgi:GNAT superfamily N-acetyltransferase
MNSSYSEVCGTHHLAIVDLSQVGSTLWEINRVNVPAQYRGKGIASRLMARTLADADKEGITLRLVINAYGDMSFSDLYHWYERLGFNVNDAEGSPNEGFLVRLPKETKWETGESIFTAP